MTILTESIFLQLNDFCIETTTKKRIKEICNLLIENDDIASEKLSNELEFLNEFVQATNFLEMRDQNPQLRGGVELKVEIIKSSAGFKVEIMK